MAILRCVYCSLVSRIPLNEFAYGQPQLLMPVIQYVMPSKNKALKKLLHFYWEVCPKYDENGKLKQEMILVVYVCYTLQTAAHSHASP